MGVGQSAQDKDLTLDLQFSNPSTNYRFHFNQAVIKAVRRYVAQHTIDDEITLFVLKQK